ncbi:hypothetical protein [Acididesulfobacillus acetoxydans]|uniref:hypothetical protein n=1 Tax=Acididesulfobacillus acetoxydans TaxID=1561005 RepID=UPI001F0E4067|nr:hypothetical protein [Acididesulfobacillus acetoxydans]
MEKNFPEWQENTWKWRISGVKWDKVADSSLSGREAAAAAAGESAVATGERLRRRRERVQRPRGRDCSGSVRETVAAG